MKYRKKTIVIDAIQWVGSNFMEVVKFTGLNCSDEEWGKGNFGIIRTSESEFMIYTPDGPMTAWIGDWIITGANGEHYPCRPDTFKATYELVED